MNSYFLSHFSFKWLILKLQPPEDNKKLLYAFMDIIEITGDVLD